MTSWSVAETQGSFGLVAMWQLVATSNGISKVVASFMTPEAEQLAVRCRDLLARHGTVDVPITDLEAL